MPFVPSSFLLLVVIPLATSGAFERHGFTAFGAPEDRGSHSFQPGAEAAVPGRQEQALHRC